MRASAGPGVVGMVEGEDISEEGKGREQEFFFVHNYIRVSLVAQTRSTAFSDLRSKDRGCTPHTVA